MKKAFKLKYSILISLILTLSLLLSGCELLGTLFPQNEPPITLDSIPEFDGETPYAVINNNIPFFDGEDTSEGYEKFGDLDALGRCSAAIACITPQLMPTEDRGEIGNITPSGWQSVKYDIISGKYLYNRSHLIGFQLTGENDNEKNLITGTRFMNVEGMLPFENIVAAYVKDTGEAVLYRVTPIFKDSELVARGVLMEAMSVGETPEENGEEVLFCVYVYNCQPGIVIDYSTGKSRLASDPPSEDGSEDLEKTDADKGDNTKYILNTKSKKFHLPSCQSAENILPENREESDKSRQELIDDGYSACGICKP